MENLEKSNFSFAQFKEKEKLLVFSFNKKSLQAKLTYASER